VAARYEVAVGAIAVAWTLAFPGVTGAIVGGRSPQQVDGWVPAAHLRLTAADLDEIAAALQSLDAGDGPLTPSDAELTPS
jgi:aryl-alcohol dehydrogenase-like predicted oxidoreductase